MLSDSEIEKAASQLADYRRNDALPDIIDNYSTLIDDFKRLKSDYEEERDAREKYKQMARGQERNPMVLVLVDGDGYLFREDIVSRGADGGSIAAQLLHDSIKDSLRRKGLEHCQIMVRIYANVSGLSKTLSKAGQAGPEKRSLAPFIASFNRSYGLSDFVDAGELKENADFKLRALLHLYAENAQCKHIYFAACHDVGYIADLTPHTGNSSRWTLINTPGIRFHPEFQKLGLGIEELPQVFRSTPLDGPSLSRPSYSTSGPSKPNPAMVKTTSALDEPSNTDGRVCRFHSLGKCKYGKSCKNIHADNRANTSTWRSSNKDFSVDSNGYVAESGNNKASTLFSMRQTADAEFMNGQSSSMDWRDILKLPKTDSIPEGHIAVNDNNHRLDPYVQPPSPETINRLKGRINKQRLCNNYHLTGRCSSGDHCAYDHEPLEPELRRALQSLAFSLPCSRRGNCRQETCTSGHVCQNLDCKRRGGKIMCKIPYLAHSEDLAVARYVPAVFRPSQSTQASIVNDGTTESSVNGDEIHEMRVNLLTFRSYEGEDLEEDDLDIGGGKDGAEIGTLASRTSPSVIYDRDSSDGYISAV